MHAALNPDLHSSNLCLCRATSLATAFLPFCCRPVVRPRQGNQLLRQPTANVGRHAQDAQIGTRRRQHQEQRGAAVACVSHRVGLRCVASSALWYRVGLGCQHVMSAVQPTEWSDIAANSQPHAGGLLQCRQANRCVPAPHQCSSRPGPTQRWRGTQ